GFNVDYDAGNTQFVFLYHFAGFASFTRTGSAANTWYHIAIVINNVGNIQTWFNGSLLDQRTGTYYDSSRGKSRLLLGHAAETPRGFTGYIQDFRLYDYALRDYQISDMIVANYRQGGIAHYKSPSNYLVTRHNWYNKMTFVQNGGATFASGDPDPYVYYYIGRNGSTGTNNQVYMNTRIQDYQSFTCSFNVYTNYAVADHFYFFCG